MTSPQVKPIVESEEILWKSISKGPEEVAPGILRYQPRDGFESLGEAHKWVLNGGWEAGKLKSEIGKCQPRRLRVLPSARPVGEGGGIHDLFGEVLFRPTGDACSYLRCDVRSRTEDPPAPYGIRELDLSGSVDLDTVLQLRSEMFADQPAAVRGALIRWTIARLQQIDKFKAVGLF
jgi:hypothetical protein